MTGAYRAVAGRIRQDLDDVRQVADRAEAAWERYEATEDDHYLDSVALNLHDVYVGRAVRATPFWGGRQPRNGAGTL